MDVYTTYHQPPEHRNDKPPALSVPRQPQIFIINLAETPLESALWLVSLLICPFVSSAPTPFHPCSSPPHSVLPLLRSPLLSPPSPALASNCLNRLASCQSRGLLWLCHKSARKNRNHLFRPGPESGWGCKYMSLGLACAHWTTEPSGESCTPTLHSTSTPTSSYVGFMFNAFIRKIYNIIYYYIYVHHCPEQLYSIITTIPYLYKYILKIEGSFL